MNGRDVAGQDYDKRLAAFCKMFVEELGEDLTLLVSLVHQKGLGALIAQSSCCAESSTDISICVPQGPDFVQHVDKPATSCRGF